MIILEELEWDNCFSYGDNNKLKLNETTVTQLVGTNGQGKSSIPLILQEAIFNKNSKGVKKSDIPNRNSGVPGYKIRLKFKKDGITYEINIQRSGSVKVQFIEGGKDISSHTATNTFKDIERVIGKDFKTISQLIYQSTESSLQFLTATDTNRKKFLIDLFALEEYTRLFDIFKEAAKSANDSVKVIEGEINTITSWLDRNKLSDTTLKEPIKVPNYPEEEEKSLRSLLVEIENISQNNKIIEQNNKYRELLLSIDIDKCREESGDLENLDDLRKSLSDLKADERLFKKQIESNKNTPDTCRTCGQPVDNSTAIKILKESELGLAEISEKISEIEPVYKAKDAENNKKSLANKKIREWEELYTKVDRTLPKEVKNAHNLREKAQELQTEISEVKQRISKANIENTEIEKYNSRIGFIEEQVEEFNINLDKAKEKLIKESELFNSLELLKKAFSTNGLVAYKIENLVKDLEELTNHYLSELSDGRFTLEFVISNDKLNISITDNAKVVDILALSSGELARVNTATLLAIRKLMSSISKSRINVLFLDEVISVLDVQGKERLVEVLLKEEDLNTFVVSHGWTHPLLNKVEVIKENNISRLE